jgi:hypothetical protein
VASVTGQQQDPAELAIVDELRAGAAQRRVELIARGVLGVVAEDIAGDEPGLADAIEELIAALRPRRLGDDGNKGRDGETKCRRIREGMMKPLTIPASRSATRSAPRA